jgi:ferrous iron transport protein A
LDLEPPMTPLPSTLDRARRGQPMRVLGLDAPAGAPEWALRLDEIGFVEGERVQLLRRGVIGGDPLMVRVGLSVFALRRAEAACVRVAPSPA